MSPTSSSTNPSAVDVLTAMFHSTMRRNDSSRVDLSASDVLTAMTQPSSRDLPNPDAAYNILVTGLHPGQGAWRGRRAFYHLLSEPSTRHLAFALVILIQSHTGAVAVIDDEVWSAHQPPNTGGLVGVRLFDDEPLHFILLRDSLGSDLAALLAHECVHALLWYVCGSSDPAHLATQIQIYNNPKLLDEAIRADQNYGGVIEASLLESEKRRLLANLKAIMLRYPSSPMEELQRQAPNFYKLYMQYLGENYQTLDNIITEDLANLERRPGDPDVKHVLTLVRGAVEHDQDSIIQRTLRTELVAILMQLQVNCGSEKARGLLPGIDRWYQQYIYTAFENLAKSRDISHSGGDSAALLFAQSDMTPSFEPRSISALYNDSAPERETPPRPFAIIPFSRDPDFVDRGDVLEQIDQRCSEPASRVALVGHGGAGKSQLAIEFAHRIAARQLSTWVFWVDAGTREHVENGFRRIASAGKVPVPDRPTADILRIVYKWLSNERNGKWIMILDGADDCGVFYGQTGNDAQDRQQFVTYLPQSRNGSILVTTRDKDLASRLTGRRNITEVGPMAPTDALSLLKKKLGFDPNPDDAIDLVQALDFIPLAISQAAAYIQARPKTSPETYVAEFRKSDCSKRTLLDATSSDSILTTLQRSFNHIRSKRPSAADLLALMSFFNQLVIPECFLNPTKDPAVRDGESDDSDSFIDGGSDNGTYTDNLDFEDDVAMLRDYCLITVNETGEEFEMHRLVQLSIRGWLEATGEVNKFEQQYMDRMSVIAFNSRQQHEP